MAKSYSLAFVTIFLLTLGSCQSLEQISIDYLQPADLSFPPQLRKVAIVNNTSNIPDNKLIATSEKIKEGTPLVSRATAYANGDPKIATESLKEHCDFLGHGIAGFINTFSPQKIVIGGGLSEAGDFYIRKVSEKAHRYAISDCAVNTEIMAAALGNKAGSIGAASLFFNGKLKVE